MHFNLLSPLVKAILGKKIIYFSIGSFYGAISVSLSILYVDWLRRGPASLYPGGDNMHTSGHRIDTWNLKHNYAHAFVNTDRCFWYSKYSFSIEILPLTYKNIFEAHVLSYKSFYKRHPLSRYVLISPEYYPIRKHL